MCGFERRKNQNFKEDGDMLMNKALLAGAALAALAIGSLPAAAADLAARPVYKAPVAVPMIYNWSGFYIGGHVGYGWADSDWNQTFSSTPAVGFPNRSSGTADGFLGGGQIGVNWQSGMWVFGVEGDFSWTDANGCGRQSVNVNFAGCSNSNWYATATGRLGVAFDRSLLYVKGGAAFTDQDHFITFNGVTTTNTISDTRTGWTVGAGLEYAFWDNWSVKVEYNYLNFDRDNHSFTYTANTTPAGLVERYDVDQQVQIVKLGVNYRFNWGAPVVARY